MPFHFNRIWLINYPITPLKMSSQCLKDQIVPSSDLVCFLIWRARFKRRAGLDVPRPYQSRSLQTLDRNISARGIITSRLKRKQKKQPIFRSVPPTQCLFEKQTKSCPEHQGPPSLEHLVHFHLRLPFLHFMLYNYSDRDAAFSQLRTMLYKYNMHVKILNA